MDSPGHRCVRLASDFSVVHFGIVVLMASLDWSLFGLLWNLSVGLLLRVVTDKVRLALLKKQHPVLSSSREENTGRNGGQLVDKEIELLVSPSMSAAHRWRRAAMMMFVPLVWHCVLWLGPPLTNHHTPAATATDVIPFFAYRELRREVAMEGHDNPATLMQRGHMLTTMKFWGTFAAPDIATKWTLLAVDLVCLVQLYVILTLLVGAAGGESLDVVLKLSPVQNTLLDGSGRRQNGRESVVVSKTSSPTSPSHHDF